MFFLSIKSVRGYTCVQLFVSVSSMFLFARCMRKESESHGAYQDFIRYIGAPNVLLTDNTQTQTGKKWRRPVEDCKYSRRTRYHTTSNRIALKAASIW